MLYLLDTHILLWYLAEPSKLKTEVNELLRDTENEIYFSAVSIQEIAIKSRLSRSDYSFQPAIIADAAQEVGFLPIILTPIPSASALLYSFPNRVNEQLPVYVH
ncbi:PIN domain-containing protein [Xenorhabdus sp. Flor]|uniref:type II toxin-antitoxin system VapC family toxin n=1 Tax=Xenorhabdus cabanillasii TaxID=351673 RepID=UPI0019BCFFFC|nr:PIN domain-containing protein [Xenorhabdus sp. Flor]